MRLPATDVIPTRDGDRFCPGQMIYPRAMIALLFPDAQIAAITRATLRWANCGGGPARSRRWLIHGVAIASATRNRLPGPEWRLSSVEIAAHGLPVEARRLKLAHDHADVLLAEVLFAVTRNRYDDAGLVAKAPMARSLAAEFGEAVIG